jgi:hypothetical protein
VYVCVCVCVLHTCARARTHTHIHIHTHRLLKYVSELMPYYPELPSIVVQMAATNPQHLRVKAHIL